MKFKSYLKLASASLALGTALSGFPALAETFHWTGESSYYYEGGCKDEDGASVYCAHIGNTDWNNEENWSSESGISRAPNKNDDVNIGLSTYQKVVDHTSTEQPYPRPSVPDTVIIGKTDKEHEDGYDAEANNIYIGFSGDRTDKKTPSTGAGSLNVKGELYVENNVVVGSTGNGVLHVEGLIRVNGNTIIGDTSNTTGTVNVFNDGDLLINGNLMVGESGNATLNADGNVEVGGSIVIGENDGSKGIVNIYDDASLTTKGNLTVGESGNATLNANGNVQVGGNTVIGVNGGSIGEVNVADGGTLNTNHNLTVGQSGEATLNADGNVLVGGNTVIGVNGNSIGTVNVADTGKLETKGNLTVGESGEATLNANGNVQVGGNTVIGVNGNSIGTVNVANGATLNTDGNLTVGESGNASLVISEGGNATTDGRVVIGQNSNSNGSVTNSGQMINGEHLIVGDSGHGTLLTTGTDARTSTKGTTILGSNMNGVGVAHVANGGGMTTNGLLVGNDGWGELLVDSQGTVDSGPTTILGNNKSGVGVARVTNEGGMTTDDLLVGNDGKGILVVDKQGTVDSGTTVIAAGENSHGYVVVKDKGSELNSSSITLANKAGSNGTLVISDEATVNIDGGKGTLVIAAQEGSSGTLNIGAMLPESGTRDPGTLNAKDVVFGDGDGTVNFKHLSGEHEDLSDDYVFQAGFKGKGTINHSEGFTVLTGDSSGLTKDSEVNITGGTLVADNALGGTVIIGEDGRLRIGHDGANGKSGDVLNDITNNGLVDFNRSDDYTWGNVISGTGAVNQIGDGTTIVTGENTYTGKTTISNGTLQLGNGGTTGSIDETSGVTIGDNGTLAFNRSDEKTFDRVIDGSGNIRQIGTGTTTLTENNSAFTGETTVEKGTLSVTGTLGGSVDVWDTATLIGTGTVGDTTVKTGGTIAPGVNDIGTLNVDGDFTQENGSTYQAELGSEGESDLIKVSGKANLEDGAVLNVTNTSEERYELERVYKVVETEGGVIGQYTLTGDTNVSAFYDVVDLYAHDNVYLKVQQTRDLDEAAWTRNQKAAAGAAQELKSQVADPSVPGYEHGGKLTNPLFTALAYLPNDEAARHAFDQISGEVYASTTTGLIEQSRHVREATTQRIRNAFNDVGAKTAEGEVAEDYQGTGISLWLHGYGSWGSTKSDGNAARLKSDIGGFFAGADANITENFRLGLLAGYSQSTFKVNARNSKAKSDNFDLGIYGGGKIDNIGFRLGVNHTWHSIDTDRTVAFEGFQNSLSSDHKARTTQVYGDIGYEIDAGGAKFEPFAGLAYVHLKQGRYSETGFGNTADHAAALKGRASNDNTTYGTLGLRASATWDAGIPVDVNAMVGYRHAFSRVTPEATHAFSGSSLFTVAGVPLAKNVAVFDFGVEMPINQDIKIGLSYSGQAGNGVSEHGLRGNLNWKF